MDIVRNDDGTLVVPVQPERRHDSDDDADTASVDGEGGAPAQAEPTTRVLHPGEGGYDEALWRSGTASRIPTVRRWSRPPTGARRR